MSFKTASMASIRGLNVGCGRCVGQRRRFHVMCSHSKIQMKNERLAHHTRASHSCPASECNRAREFFAGKPFAQSWATPGADLFRVCAGIIGARCVSFDREITRLERVGASGGIGLESELGLDRVVFVRSVARPAQDR